MRKLTFLGILVLLLGTAATSNADEVYGRIRGTVLDPTGAGVPGADVKATNTQTGVSTALTSSGDGTFQFLQLPVGTYDVTVTKAGFRTFTARNILLVLNHIYDLTAALELGQLSESIQVEANPAQVETTVTQLGTAIDGKKIVDIPLNGRNWTSLEQMIPGVVAASDRFATATGGTYSSNGSQSQQNSFLIDGADSSDLPLNTPLIIPSPDAIQEFNMITSTINPEYGRNSGAILNALVKSGTNAFHGDAFEFFRDTSLNDPNFFRAPNVFHQNQFGGVLGGPIVKNHTFFFISYQGTRNRSAQALPGGVYPTVFSQAQRNGAFPDIADSTTPSATPLVGENGATFPAGTPYKVIFPTGHIPTQDFSPISANLLSKYVPPSNQPGNLYSYSPVQTLTADQGIAKVDHHFSDRDSIWASAFFQAQPVLATIPFSGSNLPGFGASQTDARKTYTAAWIHTFSPATLNEFRASYVRFNYDTVEPQTVVQPSSLGFTGINPQLPQSAGAPYINITGYFNLGFSYNGPQPRIDETYQLTDNFSKVIGSHTLKFGFNGKRYSVSNPFAFINNGYYGFGGSGQYSTGNPGADFLLGIPDFYEQTSGGHEVERTYEYYMYVQDSWKATRNLTLNFGAGYQIDTPLVNKYFGGIAFNCFRPGQQSTVFPTAPAGLVFPGDTSCSASGYSTHYDNIGPRFGFAYSPEAGWLSGGNAHKFVIRGGFGVYFNRTEEEVALQNLLALPFSITSFGVGNIGGSPSFANPFKDIATGKSIPNQFPFTPPPVGSKSFDFSFYEPISFNTTDPHFAAPYAMNFNLNVQRELPGAMILQVGYVGALGRHLEVAYEGDPITLAGAAACAASASCIANRTIQQQVFPTHTQFPPGDVIASAGTQSSIGVSSYNSLQVSLNKRLSHGLSFVTSYTYSHSIDDGSGYEESSGQAGSNGRGFNPYNAVLSRGDSAFDARHRFVAGYDYELPHLTRFWNNNFVKYAFDGWRVSGFSTFQTGFPFSPYDSTFRSLTCSTLTYYGCPDGPNGVGPITTFDPRTSSVVNKVLSPTSTTSRPYYWFDPNQFTRQAFGTFGTSGRNSIHGPGIIGTDFALDKQFLFTEQRQLELRLEAFNLFNHANFNLPSGNIASQNFGRITGAQPGRLVQLGVKVYF
ncbi:MAG TPA: carboxypeptidase-like regulatory domain-containing protein [Bryobacteraceae bacterium]|nr:carboxypeptidase-like regulatory domain-containing protein [Bryobacteraceae bacterium]